ncbi:MAG: GTPase Era [Bacteriovoracaceae bacterium]|jgi:GTPase|nr:GTPase Era [Bacteriovoracaceae bacterium]
MLLTDQHPHNKSIVAGILGVPNVGKSTLINYLLGFDLSAVTHKAQTTRNQFHCVLTIDHTEIILVDTPGVHKTTQEMNKRLNQQARDGVESVDVNLLLMDLTKDLGKQFQEFFLNFNSEIGKTWVIFTKKDLLSLEKLATLDLPGAFTKFQEVIPSLEKFYVISAKDGSDVHLLTGDLCDIAQEGPHHYMKDAISNKSERFFATEYIREQAFHCLDQELPYELAVTIDEFKEFNVNKEEARKAFISASIIVNRPSQRAIVIGRQGSVIKKIGTSARKKIEAMVGGPVRLNLHVKVAPKWFNNNKLLEEIGLPRATDSRRVWRQR